MPFFYRASISGGAAFFNIDESQDAKEERALNFEHLSRVMRRLAIEAGDIIMEIYNSDEFEVRSKSDASPVS